MAAMNADAKGLGAFEHAEAAGVNVEDATANRAIREVASTPSPQHIIPAELVAFLYRHVDLMRAEFFGGKVPEVVLSFDVTDRRVLGHFHLRRNGLCVKWVLNLNPIHLARPGFKVLATLAHELVHAWQTEFGSPAKPPLHNREYRERCATLGLSTDRAGHDLGVRYGSPFEDYCRRHGVPFPEGEMASSTSSASFWRDARYSATGSPAAGTGSALSMTP